MAVSQPSAGFWRTLLTRRNLSQILLWPAFCAAAAAVLWGLVLGKLDADKTRFEGDMLTQAAALARSVAKGLSLSVLQVDVLSRSLQSHWESGRSGELDKLVKNSALDNEWHPFVGYADRHGRMVAGSSAGGTMPRLSGEDYFQFHRSNTDRGLRIGRAGSSVATGQEAIEFTRRLDARDGSFDGVALVSVRPAYLTGFYDEGSFGKRGYLGVRSANGDLYAARMGAVQVARPLLRVPPFLDARSGRRLLSGAAWPGGNEKGIVAWQQIAPYPLFVVVGLAENEVLAPYRIMAADYIAGAVAASWFLLLSAVTGSIVMAMLIWRKQQAQETQDAYRLATESANEGFFFLRALYNRAGQLADFVIEDCNRAGAILAGVAQDQMVGLRLSGLPSFSDFLLASDMPSQVAIGSKAMAEGIYQDEWTPGASSSFRGLWLHRKMIRVGGGLAVTLRDITAAKAHEKKLLTMAHEDALTRLPNRHWLMDFLPGALARARRSGGKLALFFIDLDNFKYVNDTLGHAAGDALLHVVAMRLQAELRPGDSLARLGGDEFTVVLEEIDDARDAQLVAERIVHAIRQPIELGSGKAIVGSSIGISLFPSDGQEIDTLLRHADIAMYAAKSAGKGRFCFYQSEQYEALLNRLKSKAALENAVREDQFVLHYQPRLSSESGRISGIEALVRWQDPERGLLAPREFIGLAEATGLILPLGALVMEKVCAQAGIWAQMRLPPVPVSFNVSAAEFNQGDVRAQLASCIERHRIRPEWIEVELTETMLLDEKGDTGRALAGLRLMGVKCLIDDFGTGFSSLSQLQRFDTDILKIDQSLTAELGRTKKAETFYRAIVSMAHALDMEVVAEGVETVEQLRLAQLLGCNGVQGFYVCRPVPASEMTDLLCKGAVMAPNGVLA